MAGTEEDWDGAPMIIEPGAFAGQDGKTIPVIYGGLGGPVIGQATVRVGEDGASFLEITAGGGGAYCRKDMHLQHPVGECPYDDPEADGG